MDAAPYITRIRRALQDYTSPTRAGVFWDTYFVKLALNTAQEVVTNYLLRTNKAALLERLVSTFAGTGPVSLPADYLHFISATVSSPARTARVYIGGEGCTYLYTVHDAAIILGTDVYFVDRGTATGSGVLYYYRRPNKMLVTGDAGFTTAQDFDLSVYDEICKYAVAMLGAKETITGRDVAARQTTRQDLSQEVPVAVHYPIDRESIMRNFGG